MERSTTFRLEIETLSTLAISVSLNEVFALVPSEFNNLSVSLSNKKIRTNSLSPGAVPNPKNLDLKFKNKLKRNIPMNRLGAPREVAEPVVFLLSESSSYINGENIIIDGGWTVW